MSVGRRYYIVVSGRPSTISWVILVLVTLLAPTLFGQQPKRRREPLPFALLPAAAAWQLLLEHPPSAGGAMDASRLYIPLESKQVIALERSTGATVWTAEVDTAWAPVASGGLVFVAAADAVEALDAATGRARWRLDLGGMAGGPMSVGYGRLVVPLASGQLVVIDAEPGRLAWTSRLDGEPGSLSIGIDQARVYAAGSSGRLTALSLADGSSLWQRDLGGALTTPLVARDRLVIGTSADHFYALDPESGSERWHWDIGADAVGAGADEDLIFLVALDNTVKAVNRGNGHQQWRAVVTTRPIYPPIAFGGTVLAIGDLPTVSAFSAKKGDTMGTYSSPARLQGPPLIDRAPQPFSVAMVMIMNDGNVIALTPESMQFREQAAVPFSVLPGRQLPREPPPAVPRLR